MSRTLYSPRKTGQADFFFASKIFFAFGLGGKTFRDVKIDKVKSAQSVSAFVQEAGTRIKVITEKLQRLLDGYLEQDIDREIYRIEKLKLLSEKKSLEEQNIKLEQKQNDWLEPMAKWINYAQNIEKIVKDSNFL